MGSEQTLSLVGQIYDAATDTAKWGPCLASMADHFGAGTAQVGIADQQDRAINFLELHGFDDLSLFSRYLELHEEDPRNICLDADSRVGPENLLVSATRLHEIRQGSAFHCREVFPPETLHDSRMYREVCSKINQEYTLAKTLKVSPEVVSILALSRGAEQAVFTRDECKQLDEIGVHAERALQIYVRLTRLDTERRMALQLLDIAGLGVLLVDERGLCLYTNPAAKSVLESADGLSLRQGKLHSANPQVNNAIRFAQERALSAATEKEPISGVPLRADRISSNIPYGLLVSPVTGKYLSVGRNGTRIPMAAIFIADPLRALEISEGDIALLFDLTPAQAGVASALVKGESVSEISARLGIQENTVRAHLKAIFRAMDCGSQSEVVRAVLQAAPWFDLAGSIDSL